MASLYTEKHHQHEPHDGPPAWENSTSLHFVQNRQRLGAVTVNVTQPEFKTTDTDTTLTTCMSSTVHPHPMQNLILTTFSFLPQTIRNWNALPTEAFEAYTLDTYVSCGSPTPNKTRSCVCLCPLVSGNTPCPIICPRGYAFCGGGLGKDGGWWLCLQPGRVNTNPSTPYPPSCLCL